MTDNNYLQCRLKNVNQVSDLAHGPLVAAGGGDGNYM